MPDTIEDLVEEITTASEPGYRGRLVARGLARGLLWSDGVLPLGAPAFSETLDSDLGGYGYGLAHLALRRKEAGGPREVYEQGLQKAAEALESVVRKGDRRAPSRGLDTTAGAAMYHLSHYGARAYSLIGGDLDQLNLAPFERLLCHLLRHDLDGVRATGAATVADPEGQDSRIAAKFRDDTNDYDFADAVAAVVTSGLAAALLRFEFALSRGDLRLAEQAKEEVRRAEEFAKAANHPTAWWILRLARHVLGELWENSAHVLLPEDDLGDWNGLRRRYLAILSDRPTSEIILWPSQRAAASRATDDSDDLVVSLPTSAGKTRIAELCILRALSKGRRAVYVTPLRALSAQVERSLTSTFSPLGYSVSSLYGASGATSFDRDTLANRHIVVSTPEKLDFAIRSQPDLLDDVGVVVLDEGHMIGLDEREIRYEVLLQRLLRRADADERRLVCLSAVLPEGKHLDHFVSWIRQDEPGEPVRESWRPTRQMFGRVSWRRDSARLDLEVEGEKPFLNAFIESQSPTGRREKLFPADQAELVLATAWRLARDGHQVLVFAPQKRSVNSLANAVLKLHRQGLLSKKHCGPKST